MTGEETRDTLELWGKKYYKLRSASNKDTEKICNGIFIAYKENFPDSERTVTQVKKRIQNLEYEYKLLKQQSQSTSIAGFKKIKEGFPYFHFLEDVMGHRNSSNTSPSPQLQESVNDTEENLDDEL